MLLYSYPQNEFVTILLRAPLEISQVVFDSTATHVAIASLYGPGHRVASEAACPWADAAARPTCVAGVHTGTTR